MLKLIFSLTLAFPWLSVLDLAKVLIIDELVEETADGGVDDYIFCPGLVETLDEVCQVLFYLCQCWKLQFRGRFAI